MNKKATNPSVPSLFSQKEGTTITETIFSLVIFALFITGACGFILSQRQLSDRARSHYTAINIAKNQIEQVRTTNNSSFEQIFSMQEDDTPVDSDGDPMNETDARYKRTTVILNRGPYLMEIIVTVKIRNPNTLQFGTESEMIQSYMAHQLAR